MFLFYFQSFRKILFSNFFLGVFFCVALTAGCVTAPHIKSTKKKVSPKKKMWLQEVRHCIGECVQGRTR